MNSSENDNYYEEWYQAALKEIKTVERLFEIFNSGQKIWTRFGPGLNLIFIRDHLKILRNILESPRFGYEDKKKTCYEKLEKFEEDLKYSIENKDARVNLEYKD